MTDKKEEWELGFSKAHPPIDVEKTTEDFSKSDMLVGQTLDGRFLIERDLTEGGADAGGIGLVYLAKDMKLLGKFTVVKILQKSGSKMKILSVNFSTKKKHLLGSTIRVSFAF